MCAGRLTPSDAGICTIAGLIHGPRRYSALADVVRRSDSAPARLATRKRSGGWFTNEYTSASQRPSGDGTAAWPPDAVVTRVLAPPFTDMRYCCCSNGDGSLVVR